MNTPRNIDAAWSGLLAWGLGSAVLNLVAPLWPQQDAIASRLGFVLAFGMVATAVVVGAIGAARARLSGRITAAALLPGALVIAVAHWAELPPAAMGVISGAVLLVLGTWIGAGVGRGVTQASYLWPLVLVAVGADVWSVTSPEGVTNQLVNAPTAPNAVSAIQFIVLGVTVPGVGPSPLLGVGDVLFTGLLAGAVVTLGLSVSRLVVGLTVGYALTAAALLALEMPLPALPFIGLAGVAAQGASAKPKLSELAMGLVFLGVLFGARMALGA